MSTSQDLVTQATHITPPSSFANDPLTPPPTDEIPFPQARRIVSLFKSIQDGRYSQKQSWSEFQLVPGEYDEIERQLERDEALSGYIQDKIRYDYNVETRRLVVRMPSGVHELFIDAVEDAIRSQLKAIRSGSGPEARFAQKVRPARSTEIEFPAEDVQASGRSKYEPDASFWHENAQYPGVIVEVAYSQKKKRLDRLAEDYLLDSDASVQVVVGLDIEYGKRGSRQATLSVWRTRMINTDEGAELRVFKDLADEPFRDDRGMPTAHPGLRLRLSDFAYEELAQEEIGENDQDLMVSAEQLCDYLTAAEKKVQQLGSLGKHSIAPRVKKRKRSETPPEEITSSDEARYILRKRRGRRSVWRIETLTTKRFQPEARLGKHCTLSVQTFF
ncbi:hypothetical protein EJ04DRAFT_539181 [Polyplosphaeria fusca]|uniref:Uncharacterized protein n=1 Tax=Polyplosphaeria fusca TaxID=682080 RepID=A0A9P4QL91_9PLEO|nr:hypothetical protein EJ04DRAFT_539181 [Polyplosphaeria fusca]